MKSEDNNFAFSLVRCSGAMQSCEKDLIHVQKDVMMSCGRAIECDIVLNSMYVSRNHFDLDSRRDEEGKPILLAHDRSYNGTWLNGVMVTPKAGVRVMPGDVLSFISPKDELDHPDVPSFRLVEGQVGPCHGTVIDSGGVHSTVPSDFDSDSMSSCSEKPAKKCRIKLTPNSTASQAFADDAKASQLTQRDLQSDDSDSSTSEKPLKKCQIKSEHLTDSETFADDAEAGQLIQRVRQSGNDGVQCTAAGSSTTALEPNGAPLTLLFIDVGDVESEIKDHIFTDERLDPDQDTYADLNDVLEEVVPDLYFRSRLIKSQKTEWQYGSYGNWRQESDEGITLQGTPYQGTMMTWRRSTLCHSVMNFFFVRIPECRRESMYYVTSTKREDIAFNIFKLLEKTTPPFLVIGNFGFGLATLISFLRKFDEATGFSLEARLQIICSVDQKLMALFKNKENETIAQRELKGNPECLCIDISWTGSGIEPSTARDNQSDGATGSIHVNRRNKYLKLMTIGENCAELRGENRHFNEVLKNNLKLRPVVSVSSNSAYTGAIDIDETVRTLDDSFKLLKQARAEAGVYASNRTLDQKEMGEAIGWLKQRFIDYFMTNETLYNRVQSAQIDVLTGKEKQQLIKDIRGPFKSWMRSLLGNCEFCMAVLRQGYFDSEQQQELLHACLQERAENKKEVPPSQRERQRLRKEAQAARKAYREAKKLQAKGLPDSELTWPQTNLLRDLEWNVLKDNVIKANQAYKHGEGAEIRTRESVAVLRMSCNQLDNYHRQ